MTLFIAPIIEGQTESKCISTLLERIWIELFHADPSDLRVLQPNRTSRSSFVSKRKPELTEKIEQAVRLLKPHLGSGAADRGFVLILIDAEEDCPKSLAPVLLERAIETRSDAEICCVMPKRQLENWFMAAADSLQGVNGLPLNLKPPPPDPEQRSGTKWLKTELRRGNPKNSYSKTTDAIEFVRKMNLQQCRDNSPSFDKLCRELAKRLPPPPDSS